MPKYLMIVLMVVLLSINTTGKALALDLTLDSTQDTAISGNAEQLAQTINSINPYIPVIDDKTLKTDQANENYISKPEVIKTKTREEMDKEKAAEKQKALAQNNRNVISRERTSTQTTTNIQARTGSNTYFYGFCTWYAAERRADVPNNWGNAGRWFSSAKSSGWLTGSEPKPGAVLVTNESWVGHVAYVESVDGDSFTISEMNLRGWARVSTRTLPKSDSAIKGFIY